MAASTDPSTLVLHGLALKGTVDPAVIEEAAGLSRRVVASELGELDRAGLVRRQVGALVGYQLTPAGRAEHARRLAEELDAAGARPAVAAAYERFVAINPRLLEACSRWQLRAGASGAPVVNDHRDERHDSAALRELEQVHADVLPLLEALGGALERYRRYEPALASALQRVRAGEGDYFTKPLIPSYHTVWFELHEDLLATLGIERASEGH